MVGIVSMMLPIFTTVKNIGKEDKLDRLPHLNTNKGWKLSEMWSKKKDGKHSESWGMVREKQQPKYRKWKWNEVKVNTLLS